MNVSAVRPVVNPLPVSPARRDSGRYASPSDPRAVQTVILATGAIGYRVGPQGRIYARHSAAAAFARAREARMAIGGAL